ncbi:hypothetical protein VSX64_16190 [Aurantimonas sp. C2-6-R+9]|uniref:hypothetical protein n=1 Tax=unclassified Aurantimonas TaxID=2638230 RepID=UPI002E17093A|nr:MULTISPECIES: hypothetical protein [unclassified Aurantimonas]MEC5291820.1 hypothetical protein [Aurantimonas sp. C2-3-R2]MEC5382403.1 hypothetical protein [Aurantimonas sp. C2-6-R+9]MEC5412893.1 hypothetical protein [Aurantimonas sp. C2-4-R8]
MPDKQYPDHHIATAGVGDMPRPTPDQLCLLARADFWCFVELTFGILHPGQKLVYAEYLGLMTLLMMRVQQGRYRRVVINLPPRHMKSLIVSVLYVAWRLGRDPGAKFITVSYGDDLAHDHSGLTRTVMMSKRYRRIFPGTVLDKKAVDYIRTTKGGYRYATSVGSDITGFGADEIIIDDPMQPDAAASERAKERVRSWVQGSVITRFNDPRRGALILVMHRLAPDDLSATMEPEADFVLKLPMIAVEEESFRHNGKLIMCRTPGEVLNPVRLPRADAGRLKTSLPPHVWNAQYQQHPTPGGSGMLSIERFARYNPTETPAFELTIHSWDIGATISGNASVCTKWGLVRDEDRGEVVYLIDVVTIRAELPEVRAAIKVQDKLDKPALIILDERGAGLGLYQELLREGYRHITASTATDEPMEREGSSGTRPSASKIERFGRAILMIDDRKVLIPTDAPWLDRFLYEVSAFPNIADKDQVDSMSQLVGNLGEAARLARQNADRRLLS